ncbi:glycoside hydrolase family 3 C-terminal domain-containing protein [Kutzneria kofuensis]|uniref:Beta-glucosidase-like glycosyl hydrolase n=1 Tax=Kutzneria kofuensis TaxID=103725 RepID=A0A7W9KNS9_9PSEU|nr:glycoside hydrolase family 3 C-terminal domain-containing protein [Kutzneria kofuensis]MBB5895995.1 beta-glucosidase-like glycosyl hydrolase [Kutzneria kofuensis]
MARSTWFGPRRVVALAAALPLVLAVTPADGAAAAARVPVYLDTHYSFAERAADLVSRMTLPEKVAQLETTAPGIPRLGVQEYNYWSEGQHGVNSLHDDLNHGDHPDNPPVATSFPTNFAATMSWDPALIYDETTAISDEARGFLDKSLFGVDQNNLGDSRDNYGHLTYWAPTVNLDRDPRWGRTDEAFGEDPYLVSTMAGAYVNGFQGQTMQGAPLSPYLKVAATAKHYALNNVEQDRTGVTSDVTDANLRDYYTAQFASLVRDAHVAGLMTSYNAINGTPSVADTYTTNQLAQRTDGFTGYITSDCGAIGTTYKTFPDGHDWAPPGWTTDGKGEAATWTNTTTGVKVSAVAGGLAYALRAGTGLDCGGLENTVANVEAAINAGILGVGVIDNDLVRAFTIRMRTGEFDGPKAHNPYTAITKAAIQSPAHQQLARKVADNSLVLLKNEALLPVQPKSLNKVVIVGDLAGKVTLGGYSGNPTLQVSPVAGITDEVKKANPNASVVFDAAGTSTTATGAATLSARTRADIAAADLVIVFVGTDTTIASEGTDRPSIAMPGNYTSLIDQVTALGNEHTALVIQSNGPVDIADEQAKFPAVVFSGYNGESQGTALADVLFGRQNPDGHLNFTWYADDSQLPAMSNYGLTPSQTGGLGRTYQYATTTPTYPFGYGLSYSSFAYADVKADTRHVSADGTVKVALTVTNTGKTAGSTVAQLYAATPFTVPGVELPRERLAAFAKTAVLAPGKSQRLTLSVKIADLAFWDANAMKSRVYPGDYEFRLGTDATHIGATQRVSVTGSITPKVAAVTVQPESSTYQVGQTIDLTGRNRWLADDTIPSREQRNLAVTADHVVEAVNNDGSFADLGKSEVKYRSSNESVARVSPRGVVTAVGTGVATISATVDGVTGAAPIVVGHGLKITAPAIVDPVEPASITTTFTNPGATVHDVALSLAVPAGWTATPSTPATFATVAGKATVTTTWSVRAQAGTDGGTLSFAANATVGGAHDSTASADVDVAYSRLAASFDNTGISPDSNHGVGNFDGNGSSFSADALAAAGIHAGAKITHDGYAFAWPDGGPNDVAAGGQSIALAAGGSSLGFIGAATYGTQTGKVTLTYTDGTTEQQTLSFADWYGNQAAPGGDVVATMPYINTTSGTNQGAYSLYFASVPLDAGKTLQYVTLPDISHGTSGGSPSMHIFAIAAKNDSLAVTAPPIAPPDSTLAATTTYTNVSSAAVNAVTLTVAAPGGWTATATSPASFATVAPGASVQTTWQLKVPADAAPSRTDLTAVAAVGGTTVTTAVTGLTVPYPNLAAAFDNRAISDDATPADADFDGGGASYSTQALAAVGLTAGAVIKHDGVAFTWPDTKSGQVDNVVSGGQTIRLDGAPTKLGFVGSASYGLTSGVGTVTYDDGSTQQFTLSMADWYGVTAQSGGDVVASTAYIHKPLNSQPGFSVYYSPVELQPGKTARYVTLPDLGDSAKQYRPTMHLFAIGLG